MRNEKIAVYKVSAGGFVTRQKNGQKEVLLVEKSYGALKGKLAFPGGYINHHEDVESALKREVYEETAIEISSQELIGVRFLSESKESSIYFIFLARVKNINQEPRVSSESDSVKYYNLKNLNKKKNISSLVKYVLNNFQRGRSLYKTNFSPKEIKTVKNNYQFYLKK